MSKSALSDFYGLAMSEAETVSEDTEGAAGAQADASSSSSSGAPPPPPSKPVDPLSMESPGFSASAYFSTLLSTKSMRDLLHHDNSLLASKRNLDSEMQTLVYDNYNKFISATDMIRQMKTNVTQMESQMKQLMGNMTLISSHCEDIETQLSPNRARIEKLLSIHRMLSRLEFLFELPKKLTQCISHQAYEQAMEFYFVSETILISYSHMKSFQNIRVETQEIVRKMRGGIVEQILSGGDADRTSSTQKTLPATAIKQPKITEDNEDSDSDSDSDFESSCVGLSLGPSLEEDQTTLHDDEDSASFLKQEPKFRLLGMLVLLEVSEGGGGQGQTQTATTTSGAGSQVPSPSTSTSTSSPSTDPVKLPVSVLFSKLLGQMERKLISRVNLALAREKQKQRKKEEKTKQKEEDRRNKKDMKNSEPNSTENEGSESSSDSEDEDDELHDSPDSQTPFLGLLHQIFIQPLLLFSDLFVSNLLAPWGSGGAGAGAGAASGEDRKKKLLRMMEQQRKVPRDPDASTSPQAPRMLLSSSLSNMVSLFSQFFHRVWSSYTEALTHGWGMMRNQIRDVQEKSERQRARREIKKERRKERNRRRKGERKQVEKEEEVEEGQEKETHEQMDEDPEDPEEQEEEEEQAPLLSSLVLSFVHSLQKTTEQQQPIWDMMESLCPSASPSSNTSASFASTPPSPPSILTPTSFLSHISSLGSWGRFQSMNLTNRAVDRMTRDIGKWTRREVTRILGSHAILAHRASGAHHQKQKHPNLHQSLHQTLETSISLFLLLSSSFPQPNPSFSISVQKHILGVWEHLVLELRCVGLPAMANILSKQNSQKQREITQNTSALLISQPTHASNTSRKHHRPVQHIANTLSAEVTRRLLEHGLPLLGSLEFSRDFVGILNSPQLIGSFLGLCRFLMHTLFPTMAKSVGKGFPSGKQQQKGRKEGQHQQHKENKQKHWEAPEEFLGSFSSSSSSMPSSSSSSSSPSPSWSPRSGASYIWCLLSQTHELLGQRWIELHGFKIQEMVRETVVSSSSASPVTGPSKMIERVQEYLVTSVFPLLDDWYPKTKGQVSEEAGWIQAMKGGAGKGAGAGSKTGPGGLLGRGDSGRQLVPGSSTGGGINRDIQRLFTQKVATFPLVMAPEGGEGEEEEGTRARTGSVGGESGVMDLSSLVPFVPELIHPGRLQPLLILLRIWYKSVIENIRFSCVQSAEAVHQIQVDLYALGVEMRLVLGDQTHHAHSGGNRKIQYLEELKVLNAMLEEARNSGNEATPSHFSALSESAVIEIYESSRHENPSCLYQALEKQQQAAHLHTATSQQQQQQQQQHPPPPQHRNNSAASSMYAAQVTGSSRY